MLKELYNFKNTLFFDLSNGFDCEGLSNSYSNIYITRMTIKFFQLDKLFFDTQQKKQAPIQLYYF